MNTIISHKKPLVKFYFILIVISVPFWILGAMAEELAKMLPINLPINLPISALMFVCPLITTLIVDYKNYKGNSIRELMKKVFNYKKINNNRWYIPIIGLTPGVMLISFLVMKLVGMPLPKPVIPIFELPIFFIVFLFSAVCEEVGWMGYVYEHMEDNWKVLRTGIIMGLVWGVWHAIPYFQSNHDFIWVVWQILTSVFNRILIIWIFNNSGKSIFSAVIYHTMINVSVFSFPNYGSHYDPAITAIILGFITFIVVLDSKYKTRKICN